MRCPQCGDTGLKQEFFETIRFLIAVYREEPEACTAFVCFVACILLSMTTLLAK
jgi:hypothetical protein